MMADIQALDMDELKAQGIEMQERFDRQHDLPIMGYLMNAFINALAVCPKMKARPVVEGKWIEAGEDVWQCDQCGEITTNVHDNFCRNCGAEMRK